ncbi:MAG: pantoate--beta-alanine ligase [Psychromonas sp.]|nr:pantoate--beta-alanine ligase [Psychromonas sp.]
MHIINDPSLLRDKIKQLKQQGQEIAFVPTMGNLHQGHLQLVRQAKKKTAVVVVSIFVNPMQFDNAQDLQSYPKTLENDCQLLEQEGVSIVFTPDAQTIYPNGLAAQTYVEVPGLSEHLEGALRPGHFRGVSTIVNKLFNLVQPDYACFGEKDFQQLAIIKQMVSDLALPIEIIPVPIVREESGLAMSSRNNKLSAAEKKKAPLLAKVMNQIATNIHNKETTYSQLIDHASIQLEDAGFKVDAIDIVDSSSLQTVDQNSKQVVILMAAFLGATRLIDNKVVNLHD